MLTFRALGRSHIVSAPCEGSFSRTVGFPLPAPVLTWLPTAQRSADTVLVHQFSPCTNPPSTRKHSSLPTFLTYVVLWPRGCSPWRPGETMSTGLIQMFNLSYPEGNVGGRQLLDGPSSLLPLIPVYDARLARQHRYEPPPKFILSLPFAHIAHPL